MVRSFTSICVGMAGAFSEPVCFCAKAVNETRKKRSASIIERDMLMVSFLVFFMFIEVNLFDVLVVMVLMVVRC